jgi:hypothetical protein
MKRAVLTLLVAANAALVLGLAAMWVTPQGNWRNVHWLRPEPIQPDYQQMLPALPVAQAVRTDAFLSLLERPLFSSSRRPPPPPPPPQASAPPPDLLTSTQILGTYQSGTTGGVIARIDGKNRRVRLNETVNGWQLRSVQGNKAVFAGQGQTRELLLERAKMGSAAGTNAAPASAAPAPLPAQAAQPSPAAPQQSGEPRRRPRFGGPS